MQETISIENLSLYADGRNRTAISQLDDNSVNLELILGPVRQELHKVIPMTIIYCIIFITGIIGNVSTCIVIASNSYMRTSTNYYLLNLAVSDLMVLLLGLPLETYSFWSAYPWIFGETFCVVRTLAAETSSNASVLTITAFSVERYVAICHPVMKCPTLSTVHKALKMTVLIWTASALCSLPIVVQYGVVYLTNNSTGEKIAESATCNIREDRQVRHAFEVSSLLFFLIPVTLISVLYALIGIAIRRTALTRSWSTNAARATSHAARQTGIGVTEAAQSKGLDRRHVGPRRYVDICAITTERIQSPVAKRLKGESGCDARVLQTNRARLAALKMLVAVVVAFVICWAPFHIQRLISIYVQEDLTPPLFNIILFYASGILYYVSAVINPILYNVMSLKFRRAFKNTIINGMRRRAARARLRRDLLRDGGQGHKTPVVHHQRYRFSAPPVSGPSHHSQNQSGVQGSSGNRENGFGVKQRDSSCASEVLLPVQKQPSTISRGSEKRIRELLGSWLRPCSSPEPHWQARSLQDGALAGDCFNISRSTVDNRPARMTDHGNYAGRPYCSFA